MRRVTMLLAAITVMVALFAAAAYAAQILGTDRDDELYESNRNDDMRGRDGDDKIFATQFSTQVIPLGDVDHLRGNRHNDELHAEDADTRDEVNGGPGYDKCFITVNSATDKDDWENCEEVNGQIIP